MPQFRLVDIKKTVRSRSDGQRYFHPKLLEGPAVAAQIEMALAYFQSRLGRTRHEFDADMLVRFLGDPKVARGLVSCLDKTFRWRTLTFPDVLPPQDVTAMAAKDIHTPTDLRLYLYDRLNSTLDGFLPAERATNLLPLSRHLRISAERMDRLIGLDAEENAVLLQVAPTPDADQIIAQYNYLVVATLLRHSKTLELTALDDCTCTILQKVCTDLDVTITQPAPQTIRLVNRADAFGSYARAGSRLLRAVLIAAATTPDLLTHGRSEISLPAQSKHAVYILDKATLSALTNKKGHVLCAPTMNDFANEWARCRATIGTLGWRLVSLPEPILCSTGLAVAPFACQRDDVRVLLWPQQTAQDQANVQALQSANVDVLPIMRGDCAVATDVHPETSRVAQEDSPMRQDTAPSIISALHREWASTHIEPAAQALSALLEQVASRGFLPEADVVAALGCTSIDDIRQRVRTLDATQATYVPGVGLCSPSFAAEMRRGLRRVRSKRTPAA